MDVSFSCGCPVMDHEFRHINVVKVAESADYFDNVMTKFIVNNRTDASKTDVYLSNCPHSLVAASHKL